MKAFIEENKSLKELVEQEGFFEGLLCAVVWNRLRRDSSKEGTARNAEEEEGRKVGSKLTMTMLSTLTPKHAIYEWSLQFPEVLEIFREHILVKPMLESIASKLIKGARWGVKMRVIGEAAPSMFDLGTDIYVKTTYLNDETQNIAKAYEDAPPDR